jgi:hypothetical protein
LAATNKRSESHPSESHVLLMSLNLQFNVYYKKGTIGSTRAVQFLEKSWAKSSFMEDAANIKELHLYLH